MAPIRPDGATLDTAVCFPRERCRRQRLESCVLTERHALLLPAQPHLALQQGLAAHWCHLTFQGSLQVSTVSCCGRRQVPGATDKACGSRGCWGKLASLRFQSVRGNTCCSWPVSRVGTCPNRRVVWPCTTPLPSHPSLFTAHGRKPGVNTPPPARPLPPSFLPYPCGHTDLMEIQSRMKLLFVSNVHSSAPLATSCFSG